MDCNTLLQSSLNKVFPDEMPLEQPFPLSVLQKDTASFQLAYYLNEPCNQRITIDIKSPLLENIALYQVALSPSDYPCHSFYDDRYLRTSPGLFPDRLAALPFPCTISLLAKQWRSLWIKITTTDRTAGGIYPIKIIGTDQQGHEIFSIIKEIEVIPVLLPPNPLYHTQWFHGDCLADYYQVSSLSQKHFDIMEKFISLAVKRDINTILTPLFTPPLDTQVGGERTTIQLVQVFVDDGKYRFDFSLLDQWIRMCRRCGVRYFEMSHLFSQWGAAHPPKIMAVVNGSYEQLFGWEDEGTGEKYKTFLDIFLSQLSQFLQKAEIAENCIFHISDEPNKEQVSQYKAARDMVYPHLKDYLIIDALSDIELYRQGAVTNPVPSNDHIQSFLEEGIPDLWTYYCTGQWKDVSNRFFSLPSSANRILGVQLYKYQIKGFLHWGYNFYNSQYSLEHINPYAVTDAGGAFPSGDAFLVYPGKEGIPEESIRLLLLEEAFHDLRACYLLEALLGREEVISLIDSCNEPISFSKYPLKDNYLLSLRENLNQKIKQYLKI